LNYTRPSREFYGRRNPETKRPQQAAAVASIRDR